ncbi:MAG: hypothetical protein N3D79_04590 [Acidilobaceae archaeon]|nr:hypothetical protein [Acidilobaceae archaeon]
MGELRNLRYVFAVAALALLTLVLVLGYFDYRDVTSVRVKELRVVDLNVIGGIRSPSQLELIVELKLENPSRYLLKASQVSLTLYVKGYLVGQFSVRDIEVSPGETSLRLSLSVPTARSLALEVLRILSERGEVEVKVSATVELPVVIFGITTPLLHSTKHESVGRVTA